MKTTKIYKIGNLFYNDATNMIGVSEHAAMRATVNPFSDSTFLLTPIESIYLDVQNGSFKKIYKGVQHYISSVGTNNVSVLGEFMHDYSEDIAWLGSILDVRNEFIKEGTLVSGGEPWASVGIFPHTPETPIKTDHVEANAKIYMIGRLYYNEKTSMVAVTEIDARETINVSYQNSFYLKTNIEDIYRDRYGQFQKFCDGTFSIVQPLFTEEGKKIEEFVREYVREISWLDSLFDIGDTFKSTGTLATVEPNVNNDKEDLTNNIMRADYTLDTISRKEIMCKTGTSSEWHDSQLTDENKDAYSAWNHLDNYQDPWYDKGFKHGKDTEKVENVEEELYYIDDIYYSHKHNIAAINRGFFDNPTLINSETFLFATPVTNVFMSPKGKLYKVENREYTQTLLDSIEKVNVVHDFKESIDELILALEKSDLPVDLYFEKHGQKIIKTSYSVDNGKLCGLKDRMFETLEIPKEYMNTPSFTISTPNGPLSTDIGWDYDEVDDKIRPIGKLWYNKDLQLLSDNIQFMLEIEENNTCDLLIDTGTDILIDRFGCFFKWDRGEFVECGIVTMEELKEVFAFVLANPEVEQILNGTSIRDL